MALRSWISPVSLLLALLSRAHVLNEQVRELQDGQIEIRPRPQRQRILPIGIVVNPFNVTTTRPALLSLLQTSPAVNEKQEREGDPNAHQKGAVESSQGAAGRTAASQLALAVVITTDEIAFCRKI